MANSYKDPTYDTLDQQVTSQLGLPQGLLSAIRLHGEKSNADQVSEAGAKTVYQVTPTTRNLVLKKYGVDAFEKPENAALAAGYLLKEGLARNNDNPAQAVGEYIGGTDRKNWGKVTNQYIARVMKAVKGGDQSAQPSGQSLAALQSQYDELTAAPAQTSPDMGKIFQAYKTGKMTADDAKAFEQDVNAGRIMLPVGGQLKQGAAVKEVPTIDAKIVAARNQGLMSPEDAQAFDDDIAKGRIALPNGAVYTPQPEIKSSPLRDTLTDQSTMLGKIVNAGSGLTSAVAGNGVIDSATATPRMLIGGVEALGAGGQGFLQQIGSGIYGLGAGVVGAAQGKPFIESAAQGIEQAQQFTQPIMYEPKTNVGKAAAQVMGLIPEGIAAAAKPLSQGNEVSEIAINSLGNALAAALPLRGVGKVAAVETVRPTAPPQPMVNEGFPIQVAERPSQPSAPRPVEPLATNASDLAAQAETMQRPVETPVAATAEPAATVAPTVAESAPVAAVEAPKTIVTTVAPELLDIQRSKPIEGGVKPELQQSRLDVLKNIGLNEGELRAGVVSGDSRLLGQERELAKADTEAGQAMQKQHDLEQQKLTEYGDNIVKDTGGTFGAEAVHRGSTIFNALDQYAKEFKSSINQAYKDAGDRVGAAGVNINDFMTTLKDPANFKGGDGLSVRKDVMNTLRQRDLINPDGTLKPINAAQAEQIRQSINESWDGMKPQTQRAVGTLVNALDEAVTKHLGKDEFAAARAKRKQFAEIFENPKGIAKILEVNGKDGINHAISYEKLGDKMRQLAETDVAQFEHIKQTLSNMPNANLQALADKALGEIRAQIAEKITSAKTPAAIERAYAPYKGTKIRQIFGDELANKLDNYVAAVGVLRGVDKNPSGTASMARNIVDKATRGVAVALGTTVGGVLSGGIGLAVGGLLGEAFAGRIKLHMLEAIDAKTLNKSMSPEQFKVMEKVYEAKLKALGATPEMKQAKQVLNSGKAIPPKQLSGLSKRIESTKAWMDVAKLLTPEQRTAVKKLGVIAWLSQTGIDEETK